MRATSLRVEGFRSFASMEPIALGSINVLIGPNNAGKSSLIRALYMMQSGLPVTQTDVRLGADSATIEVGLTGLSDAVGWGPPRGDKGVLTMRLSGGGLGHEIVTDQGNHGVGALPPAEPHHFVIPYLSKRKAVTYQQDVRQAYATQVSPSFEYLAAKLARLGNSAFPGHELYVETCREVLGVVVTAIPAENGMRPGVYVDQNQSIPLEQMGEGVPNIVGLLADLALADGKLFLIEELENDLHPTALKALLELVAESSERNQFIVSTHSNLVTRHLGAADGSRLYYVDAERGVLPPEATVRPVEATPAARLEALRELGYSLYDFDLWDGWLLLEESSAERIIRDYLIPWFAPKLSRVRTIAAGGNTQVEPTFEDFHRLVRFTHLEPLYRNRAWVRVDGDDEGRAIVGRLRERYSADWDAGRFGCFDQPAFERYYPANFTDRVSTVLGEIDKRKRRELKRHLLDEVREWIDKDEARARAALAESAQPVIEELRRIEAELDEQIV